MDTRLLPLKDCDQTKLEDMIYVAAVNVEDAMRTGGALPGRDYSLRDLYSMAVPIAVEMLRRNVVTSWRPPSGEDEPSSDHGAALFQPMPAAVATDRLMRIEEVMNRTGLGRSKLYELIRAGGFVPTIRLSARCVAWSANAVEAWIAKRAAEAAIPAQERTAARQDGSSFLTVEEVLQRVRVRHSTLYRWLKAETFPPGTIVRGRRMWAESEVQEWAAKNQFRPRAVPAWAAPK